jgi:steroid 5-alpha reductase family enzyme
MTYLYIFLIILAIQIAFFIVAAGLKTDKVTDLAYGTTFVLVTFGLYVYSSQELIHILMLGMITLRGLRLAGYLFVRILHMGEDRRFDGMRETRTDFAKFWILQTVTIFVLMVPVILVMQHQSADIQRTHRLWLGIFVIGFVIESIADQQKRLYKMKHPKQHCMVWLRSKARHPNYFWEILVWSGIYVFAFAGLVWRQHIAILSPISIYLLLRYISGVPLLVRQWDKRYGDDPAYITWKQKTNMFVPL